MANLTIRNLDDTLMDRLRVQAAVNGRSMEEEARRILQAALSAEGERPGSLSAAIRRRFEPYGGVELEPLPREPMRAPPTFE